MTAHNQDQKEKAAALTLTLRADSGYEAHAKYRISAEQWGDVLRMCEDKYRTPAALDVLAERRRQVEAEGWTPEHDDEHTGFELARAGACYAEYGNWPAHSEIPPNSWPWSAAWWKPTSYRQNLVKAAALILAEIERLDRIQPPKGRD